jgi:flagellar protein FliO/FliZ
VLGLFYLLVKLVNKNNFLNNTNQIKVLERCYLGKEKVIYLVKIKEEVWVVTATEKEVNFIKQIELDLDELNCKQEPGVLNWLGLTSNEDETNES